jgi:hypothetical protein
MRREQLLMVMNMLKSRVSIGLFCKRSQPNWPWIVPQFGPDGNLPMRQPSPKWKPISHWHLLALYSRHVHFLFPSSFVCNYSLFQKDYLLLEQMLSVEFMPHNLYCYSLDAKANGKFKKRLRALANCFPNVFVAPEEFSVFSNGKNVSRSHLSCLSELEKRKVEWKYAVLLQVSHCEEIMCI